MGEVLSLNPSRTIFIIPSVRCKLQSCAVIKFTRKVKNAHIYKMSPGVSREIEKLVISKQNEKNICEWNI